MTDNWLSDCHQAPVKVVGADEGTNHWECTKCGKACNATQSTIDEQGASATPDKAKQPSVSKSVTQFWVCKDSSIASKVLGPFEGQRLAMQVRELLEFKNKPTTYWVVRSTKGNDLQPSDPDTDTKATSKAQS